MVREILFLLCRYDRTVSVGSWIGLKSERIIYSLPLPLWHGYVSWELKSPGKWEVLSALLSLCQDYDKIKWNEEYRIEGQFPLRFPLLCQFYVMQIMISFARVRGCLLKHNWITCRQDMRRWTLRWQRSKRSCRRRKAQTMRPRKRTRRAKHKHRSETRSKWA